MKERTPASKSPYDIFLPEKELAKRNEQQAAIKEERMRKETAFTARDEESRQQSESSSVEEVQEVAMTAAETHEAREREEKEIEALATTVFEGRMRGDGAEEIDKILIEKGIKPWTPEAEEFMKKWDWEQAEQVFKQLAKEREAAVIKVNEVDSKSRIELGVRQGEYVNEKFAAFAIDLDALPQEFKEEYETLTYGQRLLVAENLQQLTLGRVQEEAMQKYQDDTKESRFLGKIWNGITKKYQIGKHEQTTAVAIKKGGLEYHGELLKQLIDGTKRTGLDVIEGKSGVLELQYVEPHTLMTEKEKEGTKEFNRVATAYSKIPYEWSLDTATPVQKSEYARVIGQFEKAKEHILKTEQRIAGDENSLLSMSDIESKIRLNQFFNTHPDAEKQLQSIESDTVWKKAMGDIVTERGLYFGAGLATRTFATGLLGAVGFPLAAIGMGGWMARKRAAETLRERAVAARKGTKDVSKNTRTVMGTASTMADKIDALLKKIESEDNEEKRMQFIALLDVRLMHTEGKIQKGAVDFGGQDNRIVNQYHLSDSLTRAVSLLSLQEAEHGTIPEKFKGDIEKSLQIISQSKNNKISKAQKDYRRKQIIYGMGMGVAAFEAGYYAKDILSAAKHVLGNVWDWVGATEAHAQEIPAGAGYAVAPAGVAKAAHEAIPTKEAFHETVDIGGRGPEGAFIDELKKHPEIATRLGIKNIGKEAHTAWMEFAKAELKDPETQKLLSNLGYPKTQEGYSEMMRHIEHGKIGLEESGGKLHMRISEEDTEYLRAHQKSPRVAGVVSASDIPTGPQVFGGDSNEEGKILETLVREGAGADKPLSEPIVDFDNKIVSEDRIEGILDQPRAVTRPSIEVFMDNTFGLDADEYAAIKKVPVKELLKQIPSRDEAWAIWRDEVPGKTITLPHDGIYGALEFKKHIDLAEHIRGLKPSDTVMQGDVDTFMNSEINSKGVHANKPLVGLSTEKVVSVPPVHEAHVVPPVIKSVEAAISAESIMSNNVVAPSVEGAPLQKILTPEKLSLLNDDIYGSKVPVQKILTQYRVGNITPEDFANYYEQKISSTKPSAEMLKNMKATFSEAAGEGDLRRRALSQRALDIMVKRMQGIK